MTDEMIRLADRYELGGLLGRGGMADVRVGRDLRLGRTVAIKQLRAELAHDETFHERFGREAQAAASLNHPAIVAVYDTGEAFNDKGEKIPYIVMEHVEGQTLRDVMRDGRKILPERAMSITIEVLKALDYSHRNGIVHRDIKPANVMLTPTGAVKVMDFGIARALADASASVTQTAAVIGTAQYLSPEQARGETVDARSDIYSTGCLLYELLTGRPPFVGESPVAVAYQHVREEPRPPSQLNPDVSASVDHVIAKALAKRVDDRYQSAADMQADLQHVLNGGGVDAPTQLTPVVPATVVAATTAAVPPMPVPDPEPARGPGRSIAFGLVAALLIGFAAWWFLLRTPPVEKVTVRDVAGMTADTATRALTNDGFVVDKHLIEKPSADVKEGLVIETDPPAGTKAAAGSEVTLTVSSGPENVAVPDLQSLTFDEASRALSQLGLVVKREDRQSDKPKDEVLNTNPPAGTEVKPGTTVTVIVSAGKVEVPSAIGQHFDAAKAALEALGLTVVREEMETDSESPQTVLSQSIPSGTEVDPGTTIILTVAVPTTGLPPLDNP